MATNCWDFSGCGRQPGGAKVKELGVCPASVDQTAHGFLGGMNAGRGCAYVVGTFCGGKVQGDHEQKREHCDKCEFYQKLREEHGASLSVLQFGKYRRAKLAVQSATSAHGNE